MNFKSLTSCFSGLNHLSEDELRSRYALVRGVAEFLNAFGGVDDDVKRIATTDLLHLVKRVSNEVFVCGTFPVSLAHLALPTLQSILDRFTLYNGIMTESNAQSLSKFIDLPPTVVSGIEYAPVDRLTFLQIYTACEKFRKKIPQAKKFLVLFNHWLVASTIEPEQIIPLIFPPVGQLPPQVISTEEVYLSGERLWLVTTAIGSLRFLLFFDSVPSSIDNALRPLFASVAQPHERLVAHAKKRDEVAFLYKNDANSALRNTGNFSADFNFFSVKAKELMVTSADHRNTWTCVRSGGGRKVMTRIANVKSLTECKAGFQKFANKQLGSVYIG